MGTTSDYGGQQVQEDNRGLCGENGSYGEQQGVLWGTPVGYGGQHGVMGDSMGLWGTTRGSEPLDLVTAQNQPKE